MSNVSKAKESQGFVKKPIFNICSNCENFSLEKETTKYGYVKEFNLRCDIGGFKVGKTDSCKCHKKIQVE